VAAIDDAINKNEEGIVIKDPSSKYLPNDRSARWLKMKPDVSFISQPLKN
jgi:DNA ligase-4